METIHNSQFESVYDSLEAMRKMVAMIHAQVTNIDESHREELITSKRISSLFDNDDSNDEKNQEWIKEEESQDNTYESSPFEIQIIMPPPSIKDYIYDDPIWPTPPPPLLHHLFKPIKYMCQNQDKLSIRVNYCHT
ncbi:hypothetical protein PanWU01x14_140990 [Parasponia andersonii]|uniref:Uncharacterized protein n=1 Tax=Parasponia andersonii TaxID=3476 RepID=A0A2P5CM61_PARAD|nr:hypothetical protein PanWU01x14_140990 [Parasponia andersonii]